MNLEERFLSKVKKTDSCWIWIGATRGQYGAIKVGRKVIDAHRVSYRLYKGEIGIKLVCHTCDNSLCVNPDHLFLGTYSDNSLDAFKKGRIIVPTNNQFKLGHKASNSRLEDEQVKKIKLMLRDNISRQKISKILSIDMYLIHDIARSKSYKNVNI